MDLGCGITLDIFTHVFTRVLHKFIIIPPYIQKKIQVAILAMDIMLSHLQEKSDSLKRKFEVDNIKSRLLQRW